MEQEDGKDIGLSVLIRRKVKNMDDVLKKPLLFDKDKKPLELYEELPNGCLLYTSPSPRDGLLSRMPSSA